MRVLYVESVPGFGGSLTTLLDTLDALGREIEPILVIPYDPRPYRPIPSHVEIRVVRPPENYGGDSGRWGKLTHYARWTRSWARVLDEIVREVKPALIHANNTSGLNLAAGIVGRRHGIPVVSHQRDAEYPGWPNWLILKSGIFAHHIACSQAMVRSLTGLGLPEKRLSMMYDPIREPSRSKPAVSENDRRLVVAMYSMLVAWKGQDVFLRAISQVQKRVNRPFRAIVGGSEPFGDTGYLARLKQLTAELGLENTVEFSGFTSDIWGRLLETDVLVLASVDPEPGGHITAEAMICGVPVVVTDDGGSSEFARNSEGGLVVPRGDVDAMADAIARLLIDSDLRARIAGRGREYARRAFNPGLVADRVATIYRTCLDGRSL
jgi:glycosyltransferase involved in cell wall biosynthesis